MDTSQWHQELGLVKPMGNSSNNITTSSINNTSNMNISAVRPQQLMVERRGRPQKEQALNCPRCKSNNTKFCYYNNYSLTQPRYFCKACRRYWTEGGTLRNVPVGGSSRKNKKVPPSSSASSRLSTPVTTTPKRNPNQELNLGSSANSTVVNGSTNNAMSAMDLLKSAGAGGMMMNPFMGMPVVQEYPLGFGLHDFGANALNFPLEGGGGGSVEEGASGRMLFPFEEIRQASSSNTNHVNVNNASDHGDDRFEQQKGFWNGMNIGGVGGGGGGSW